MGEETPKRKRAKVNKGSREGKTEFIGIRVYPHEKKEVEWAAKELGLSIGDVLMLPFAADIRIRDGIRDGPLGADKARQLGAEEIVVFTADECQAFANAVNRYGHNVNQAARALNRIATSSHMSDFSLSLAVNDAKQFLEEIVAEVKYLNEFVREMDGITPFRSKESNRKRRRAHRRGSDGGGEEEESLMTGDDDLMGTETCAYGTAERGEEF